MTATSGGSLETVARHICSGIGAGFDKLVGEGAFKQVFLIQNSLGQPIALKVIRSTAAAPRTEREVDALKRCNHPNIGKLFQVGQMQYGTEVFDFTLEEFLAGGTLNDRLLNGGLLDRASVLVLGSPLIDALDHLRGLGLVHRDIKPANIMFRADGRTPVLVDFGIVRDLSAQSITMTAIGRGPGTPYFASPEQLNNEKRLTGWRSDQFSLGITLYFSLFGLHPYNYPGEAAWTIAAIDRVAGRADRHITFLEMASNAQLPCLIRMTEPWPVSRYRLTTDLAKDWAAQ